MMKKKEHTLLSELANLGPTSERMLNAIGIFNQEQVENTDPVEAYMKMKSRGMKVSINIIYAIYGAIHTLHWTRIPVEERSRLIHKLDAALQQAKQH